MRIISGQFKRKTIVPPKNFRARPTTDMAKESLFNIIENLIDISSVKALDLFGGTGGITYELASRECQNVTCVELNHLHYAFIKKTVNELGVSKQVRVVKSNVFVFLDHIKEQFDFVFADPPYDLKGIETIPDLVFSNSILSPDGLLILEHSADVSFTDHPKFTQHKKYGSVNFSFFKA